MDLLALESRTGELKPVFDTKGSVKSYMKSVSRLWHGTTRRSCNSLDLNSLRLKTSSSEDDVWRGYSEKCNRRERRGASAIFFCSNSTEGRLNLHQIAKSPEPGRLEALSLGPADLCGNESVQGNNNGNHPIKFLVTWCSNSVDDYGFLPVNIDVDTDTGTVRTGFGIKTVTGCTDGRERIYKDKISFAITEGKGGTYGKSQARRASYAGPASECDIIDPEDWSSPSLRNDNNNNNCPLPKTSPSSRILYLSPGPLINAVGDDGKDYSETKPEPLQVSQETLENKILTTASGSSNRQSSKLRRRNAYYRNKKEGRSRSLTLIDDFYSSMLHGQEDMDSKSEPDASHDLLLGGISLENRDTRRKKLVRSQVTSAEYFYVGFEQDAGGGLGEILPAKKGVCLGEALRPLCDKKNIDLDKVHVFLDSSSTPSPAPIHADTTVYAGKNLIVQAKEHDSKFHIRSFKHSSRKASQKGGHRFFSSSTEEAHLSGSGGTGSGDGAAKDFLSSSVTVTNSSSPGAATPGTSFTWQSSLSPTSGLLSHEGSIKVKNTKQINRWGGLFSNSKDNSKMDLLVEQLKHYDKNGIPLPSILSKSEDNIEATYCLEEDWRGVLGQRLVSGISESARQQQTAIWELVETEIVYIKTIKVITDLFLACLYNLQSANILNEIDRDRLFSNISDIYQANRILWLECILPMVEKARDTQKPLQPEDLRNGFLNFGTIFQPYTKYCLDQTKCQQYCREKSQENEHFKAYLAWCETRKECNRLRLMDILVRPMQRMTKYSLLLKAILRHTEDMVQSTYLEDMILTVERFVKSVNGTLRNRQDAERLQSIADTIESYDVVETRDDELEAFVKSYSKLDLFHPMPRCGNLQRWLVYEGDLKIKDSFSSKMDVHCYLFTDMLLICKPIGRKGEKMKVTRQPMMVEYIMCRDLPKDPNAFSLVYLNEYKTVTAALTLFSNNEPKLVRLWLENIRKAKTLFSQAKENAQSDLEAGEDEGGGGMNYLSSRSPRGGDSSRGSQLSSLRHSHSGSMEMNEQSAISSRAISFEQELRGSSVSSDEGNNADAHGIGYKRREFKNQKSGETPGSIRPTSPRLERRSFLAKSPTPNTLTVEVPLRSLSGQSLPNLSSALNCAGSIYSYHHSLTVPKSPLSPTHRGISYPPPSPKSLCRSHALHQSRNPPLLKGKKICSPEKIEQSASLEVPVPEIRRVTPTSNDESPVVDTAPFATPFGWSPSHVRSVASLQSLPTVPIIGKRSVLLGTKSQSQEITPDFSTSKIRDPVQDNILMRL